MKTNTATLDKRRKHNMRQQPQTRRTAVIVKDGEILADNFYNKQWFINLCSEVYKEIKRLKSCTIRQLVEGKFREIDRYHLVSAIDTLGTKLNASGVLITRYSINDEFAVMGVAESDWRKGYKRDRSGEKKQVFPDCYFENQQL